MAKLKKQLSALIKQYEDTDAERIMQQLTTKKAF